ncbi:MAG: DUF2238 domain-containing protein [Verrucomicrobiaceae bacterium]
MKRKTRIPRTILLVVALYLVAAISAAITQQNWEFLGFYIPFFFVFLGLVTLIHKRSGFPQSLLWCLAIWGAAHLAGGLVQLPEGWPYEGEHSVLYSWWVIEDRLKYDHLVHAFGFGVTTWLCWEALRANVQSRFNRKLYPSLGPVFLAVFGGMGLGALNEIIEFIAVLNLANTNVGGYYNTGWDLIANLVGCVIAGVIIFFKG